MHKVCPKCGTKYVAVTCSEKGEKEYVGLKDIPKLTKAFSPTMPPPDSATEDDETVYSAFRGGKMRKLRKVRKRVQPIYESDEEEEEAEKKHNSKGERIG